MSTPLKGPILSSLVLALLGWEATSEAAVQCQRTLVANVVALDQPLMFNRLGAQNANGMMFALREDVVDDKQVPLSKGGAAVPGKVTLRPDKRPRPIVLRVAAGDCLTVNLTNLLDYKANPNKHGIELKSPRVRQRGRRLKTKAAKALSPTNRWPSAWSASRSTGCRR